jgi:hypothetical protein
MSFFGELTEMPMKRLVEAPILSIFPRARIPKHGRDAHGPAKCTTPPAECVPGITFPEITFPEITFFPRVSWLWPSPLQIPTQAGVPYVHV